MARKNAGTKVTLESFTAWRDNFEREMDEVKRKREEEWLRALASKEREEVKKQAGKLTGIASSRDFAEVMLTRNQGVSCSSAI